MNNPTTYDSPLRRAQADLTRQLILETTLRLIVGGVEGVTMQLVAREAGVALRTVFRHFPTREDLLDAAWHALNAQLGEMPDLAGIDDVTAFIPELFGRYAGIEDQIRAVMLGSAMQASRRRHGSVRARKMRQAIEGAMATGDERSRRMAASVAYILTIPIASILLKDNFGLTTDEASHAVAWAVRALAETYAENPDALLEKDPS